MSTELAMELRGVRMDQREIDGRVAPYDATSYLTPDPRGERILRGAFAKSIRQRETKVPLCRNHDHSRAVGMSKRWLDQPDGLLSTFGVRPGADGDAVLEDARDGYLPGLSVGFMPLVTRRGADGASEVAEAKLLEVSLVVIGAYDGAQVLAVRTAQDLDKLLAPFRNAPQIDLSPLPAIWAYDHSVRGR